ncbi:cytochrome C oxidase subunit IV family protein [Solimonas soli]|jgi:hypothetical protein|uniref:cytochrome C oxidase subunit IV family protein n=1 Tax=Solimonas soli TaxID=413479 RepID=UPI00047F96E5|nr:cytochrome C oxidase subunit IV family protein [Solimonas soli]
MSTRRRVIGVWLLLIAATLLSWESTTLGAWQHLASVAVVVVAFLKVRFIGLDFMELRHAPLPLRLLFEAWVVMVCIAILYFYLLKGDPAV